VVADPLFTEHTTCGAARPVLVWRFASPMTVASSAPVGGGVNQATWIMNAQVPLKYTRHDLEAHARELAIELGLTGGGVTMLTAATIDTPVRQDDAGVSCWATVGISKPTWAADADGAISDWEPGTINVVALLPVRLSAAALLNAVVTATEAKSQALFERGVPGTGTASDAVCIVCPVDGPVESFAGPRSVWGARLARAVHTAVSKGLR
jgi:adenosylcobinamide amidohydrolase